MKKHEKRKLIFLNFEEIFLRAEVLFWLDLFLDALLSYAYDAILLVYKLNICILFLCFYAIYILKTIQSQLVLFMLLLK